LRFFEELREISVVELRFFAKTRRFRVLRQGRCPHHKAEASLLRTFGVELRFFEELREISLVELRFFVKTLAC
jgi:hypothetical protein